MAAKKQPEAEMCSGLIEFARLHGWTSYPEFGGFDFLLHRNGIQIGFHANMQFNATLIRQVIPARGDHDGPQYRAVLVPKYSLDQWETCCFIGVAYFTASEGFRRDRIVGGHGWADLTHEDYPPNSRMCAGDEWLPVWSDDPMKLPGYIPDVTAGASGPTQLTPWKTAALKLCASLQVRGFVDRDDFRRHGVDHRRWIPSGWLVLKDGLYVAGPALRFPEQHPTVFAQIVAKEQAWWAERDIGVVNKHSVRRSGEKVKP